MKKTKTIKPKEIVNLSQLKTHDRFVPVNNKKTVWQVVDHITVKGFDGEPKNMTKCINDLLKAKRFDSNRAVIFLRNNNPRVTKNRISKIPELIDY